MDKFVKISEVPPFLKEAVKHRAKDFKVELFNVSISKFPYLTFTFRQTAEMPEKKTFNLVIMCTKGTETEFAALKANVLASKVNKYITASNQSETTLTLKVIEFVNSTGFLDAFYTILETILLYECKAFIERVKERMKNEANEK